MKKTITFKKREMLYFMAFGLYIVYRVLTNSLIEAPGSIRIVIIILLLLSFVFQQKANLKRLIVVTILMAAGMLVGLARDRFLNIMSVTLLIAFSGNYDIKRLFRVELVMLTLSYLFITLLGVTGILEDRVYIHAIASDSMAHTFGFRYYGFPTGAVMTIIILYLNTKEKVSWPTLVLFFLLDLLLNHIYTARLYSYIMLVYLVAYIVCMKFKFPDLSKKWYMVVSLICYPIGLFGSVLLCLGYNHHNQTMFNLNQMLSGRLEIASRMVKQYGLRLLGNDIVQYTAVNHAYGRYTGQVTMVDFGFVNCILNNGILFTVLLTCLYSMCFYYVYKSKNKLLYLWMIIALLMNLINNNLVEPLFNPFLLVIGQAISSRRMRAKSLSI